MSVWSVGCRCCRYLLVGPFSNSLGFFSIYLDKIFGSSINDAIWDLNMSILLCMDTPEVIKVRVVTIDVSSIGIKFENFMQAGCMDLGSHRRLNVYC